jgi:hypothetical protein
MKKTLATQLVQDWSLLGLRPMHRALLRRWAEQAASTVQGPLDRKRELVWHLASLSDSSDPELLAAMCRPGVLIVDCEGLSKRVLADRVRDAVLNAVHHRTNDQIRLVWHWSLHGKQDLLWCTELSFDGVISDARSLTQWLRVCLRRGKVVEGQSNRLLQGIELPKLALPNSTSI